MSAGTSEGRKSYPAATGEGAGVRAATTALSIANAIRLFSVFVITPSQVCIVVTVLILITVAGVERPERHLAHDSPTGYT
jgi:hypothetical protein